MYDNADIPVPDKFTEDDLKKLPLPYQKLATREKEDGLTKWTVRDKAGSTAAITVRSATLTTRSACCSMRWKPAVRREIRSSFSVLIMATS